MENINSKKIAVIGAGLGGLSAASLLASLGHHVTLYERNATPGGKMQEFSAGGFRFDTGPSLLTLPDILRDLFRRCGERLEDYITLAEPVPLCRYIYPDGTLFDNHHELQKTLAEIDKFAPEDRKSYSEFLDYSKRLFERTSGAFLHNPLYGLQDLKNLHLTDTLKIDAFKTVSEKVNSQFQSDYLRKFFMRFTTYNGSSPYQAPATLNVIPHVEISEGGYYIKGGMYRLIEALVKLAGRKGVSMHFNTGIDSLVVQGKRAAGIKTDRGDVEEYDMVVSNSDATETIINLIGGDHLPSSRLKKQEKLEPSCSGFVLLLGTGRQWPVLRHHTIFFSSDYKKEFRQIFREKTLPEDPTIYVANTSQTDQEKAPAGGSNLFILVNAPYLSDGQNWDILKQEYPAVIIKKLEKSGLDGLAEAIMVSSVQTPFDFYEKYRSNRGSIYGTSSNSRLAAFVRPRNKLRELDGIYLAGGSTHPGGGIPLVILSAMHAVELIGRHEK
jgi:phytoene desaturase